MAATSNKTIAKNTIFLYARMLLVMVVGLYTSRIVLRELGVTDFGIYNVVGSIVTSLSFLSVSLISGTSRYFAFYIGKNDVKELHKYYKLSVTCFILLSVIILIIAETIGLWFINTQLTINNERMTAANWVYQFSVISFILSILANSSRSIIISYEKMSVYAYIGVVQALLKLLIAYLLIVSTWDKLIFYSFLLLLVSFLDFIFYVIYSNMKYPLICKYSFYFEKKSFKEFVSYSGWILFGTLSEVFRGQGINVLLNIFFGPVVNAARGISYQVRAAVLQFVDNFSMAARPQITKHYAAGDFLAMKDLVYSASRLCYYLVLALSVPIIIQMPYVLKLWLGEYPDYTVLFTRLVLIIILVESLASPLDTAIVASGKVKYFQVFTGGFLLLNLPFSYLALKFGYGPESAMVIAIVMAILSHGIRMFFGKVNASIGFGDYSKSVLVYCFVVTVLIFLPLWILYKYFYFITLIGLLFYTTACISWAGIVSYSIGIPKNERKSINNLIKKKLHI